MVVYDEIQIMCVRLNYIVHMKPFC